eukprot:m.445465 g.445465  ORF g.445465 m.445465 type:complete len:531 (+) comp20305_c1_seq3:1371-2963(+)
MGWGHDLWDQTKAIANQTETGIEHVTKTREFIKQIASIHQQFGKELRKACKSFAGDKKLEPGPGLEASSIVSCWNALLDETDGIGKAHESVAEQLLQTVAEPLKALAKTKKQERTQQLASHSTASSELSAKKRQYDSARRHHEKLSKEATEADGRFAKADASDNKQKAEKLRWEQTKAHQEAEKALSDLRVACDEFNMLQRQFYQEDQCRLFDAMQASEEDRIKEHALVILAATKAVAQAVPPTQGALERMTQAVEAVNPAGDCQQFAINLKSGSSPPGDVGTSDDPVSPPKLGVTVQSVNQRRVNKKKFFKTTTRKRDAVRDDFGHLPPVQRKKAIRQKLDTLEADLDIKKKSFAGLQKTIELYTSQPALGDDKAIATATIERDQLVKSIKTVEGEVYKFTLYMCALDGSEAPDPPAGYGSSTSLMSSSSPTRSAHDDDDEPKGFEGLLDEEEYDDDDEFDDEDMALPEFEPNVQVLYTFAGENDGELAVTEGETLSLLEDDDSGWVHVQNDSGDYGYVPKSYVQILTE